MTVICPECSADVSIPDEALRSGEWVVQCTECAEPVAVVPRELPYEVVEKLLSSFDDVAAGRVAAQRESPRATSDPWATIKVDPQRVRRSLGMRVAAPCPAVVSEEALRVAAGAKLQLDAPQQSAGRVERAVKEALGLARTSADTSPPSAATTIAPTADTSSSPRADVGVGERMFWIESRASVLRAISDGRASPASGERNPDSLLWRAARPNAVGSTWRELPGVLRYPLVGWGPVVLVAYAMVSWMTPFSGLGVGLALGFALLAYAVLAVRASSEGAASPPVRAHGAELGRLATRTLRATVLVMAASVPVTTFLHFASRPPGGQITDAGSATGVSGQRSASAHPGRGEEAPARETRDEGAEGGPGDARWGATAGWVLRETKRRLGGGAGDGQRPIDKVAHRSPLVLFGTFALLAFTTLYLPMAFLLLCRSGRLLSALNPLGVFRTIGSIPTEYALTLLICLLLALGGTLLARPLGSMPILGGAAAAIVAAYVVLIQLHVLGRLAHRCGSSLTERTAA